jgi:hypothetical protein
MQIRPLIQLRYGRINEPVRIPMYPQLVDATKTFLIADTAEASGTLSVKNITGLAINQILLIGEIGNENSEIIKTHPTTAPTGNTVTLASNTIFPHSANTPVYVLKFDQVEISNAPTIGGVKSVLTTTALVADSETTDYNDTTSNAGYYYARFKNSITNVFSSYSDPAPYDGYTLYSARSIIDKAKNAINKFDDTQVLTDEFAFSELDNCQIECLREFKRWSFMQEFNTIIGEAIENQLRIALPTNCDDQETTKSIYNFRLGKNPDLIWIDKEEWDALMVGIAYTTLATSIALNDLTIVLTDSSDFDDEGVVYIGGNSYEYTNNNRATNTLTITAATTTNTAGEDVTQSPNTGLPTYFTVFGGYAYFYPQVSASYSGLNFYLDYYKSLTQIQRDSDNIVLPDPTVAQYYLEWKFLKKINNGSEDAASLGAKANYVDRREQMKRKEWINRKFIFKPE